MGLQVYLDGQLVPAEEAKVSVYDHGFLYGDGVFEGIRVYKGRIFRLREHLNRLYGSAQAIQLQVPLTLDEFETAITETVRANGLRDAYIRTVVSRGKGDLGLDPRKCPNPTVVMIVDRITLYPPEYYESGMEIVTVSTRRNSPQCLNPAIKSLNYLNNIIAKIEVNHAGKLEGLMLNTEGFVAEGTGDNIFIFDGRSLSTPPCHVGILKGITRGVVMELATEMGIPVREEVFTQLDTYCAKECFMTGTGAEIMPVVKVDGRAIGDGVPGELTRRLMQRFRELTAEEGTSVFDD